MEMLLSPEHEMIRDAMRQFAQERLLPFAADWDRNHTFPAEARTKPAEPRSAWHATDIDARSPVNGGSSSVKSGKEFTIMLRRTVKNSWS